MARSPLFGLYDPYELTGARLDDPGDLSFDSVAAVTRKPRVEDLMTPDEQASMLKSLAYAGSSGLTAAGWLLDTPGAVVRGLLAEGPMKGLSALWETSDERVTGRELARSYGLADDTDNWRNFSGGLATEVLTDPLTYLSFGIAPLLGGVAKTAAGRAAQKAGLLSGDLGLAAKRAVDAGVRQPGFGKMMLQRETPEFLLGQMDDAARTAAEAEFRKVAGQQADDLLKQPMSASHRVSIPGLYESATDLYGKKYGDWVTRQSDAIGQSARATPFLGPALRHLQGMFDSRVLGRTDEADQWRARAVSEAERLGAEDSDQFLGILSTLVANDIGFDKWQNNSWRRQFSDAFGMAMENQRGVSAWNEIPEDIRRLFDDGGAGQMLVDSAQDYQRAARARAKSLGLPLADADLPYDIGYMARQRVYPDAPKMPGSYAAPEEKFLDATTELFGIRGGEAARKDYTRAFPRWVLNKMAKDDKFQAQLRGLSSTVSNETVADTVNAWLRTNAPEYLEKTRRDGRIGPFAYLLDDVEDIRSQEGQAAVEKGFKLYGELADRIGGLPTNYAAEGLPFYGDPLADFTRYVRGRGRSERVAPVLVDELAKAASKATSAPAFSSFTAEEALSKFGLDTSDRVLDDAGQLTQLSQAEQLLAEALGRAQRRGGPLTMEELAGVRIPQDLVESLNQGVQKARAPSEAKGLLKKLDNYTQRFKTLALLFPSRYTRDAYSGSFAAATKGLFNIFDSYAGAQAGRGNYKPLARRLLNAPGYENLSEEDRVLKFLSESAGQRLTDFNVLDDLGRQGSNLTPPDLFPGSTGNYFQGVGSKFDLRDPSTYNIFALRTQRGNPNWLLDAGDRAAQATDSWNRIGTYLTATRKGYSPRAAKDMADLTQVSYRPESFTSFEREIVKRLVPFYSYMKGITPLIADNLINRPAGLMGQSIRGINRAGEPSEDRFVPEYLRQSAAIPLGGEFPLIGLDTPGITRFLTNIDLPHEGVLNLFTPGLGNTLAGKIGNTLTKTAQNLLGQTNPLLKGPLEYAANRQFYSGRQLSDLFSMAEKYGIPGGRIWDQIGANLPGGSRAMGLLRQATDERISPSERAAKIFFNTLTGLKLQDVDQERTARLAARSTLNELLDQAKGMQTYENIFIKPADLENLSPQEKRQYLLYRILQSQAASASRKRKKAAENDPLAILGIG